MALTFCTQLPFSPAPKINPRNTRAEIPTTLFTKPQFRSRPRKFTAIRKATQESEENTVDRPAESQTQGDVEMTELGQEIKKAMKERQLKEGGEGGNLLSGVAEEIREIEWPAFNKVLGTTGVVLGVIAGSSVVLLTVNAVLAELSDRVFAGKGVQDFFG